MRLVGLCIATLFLTTQAHAFPAIVAGVHDGDTITVIAGGQYEKIRIHGIDAPEMAVRGKWQDQPYGWDAHTALFKIVPPGSNVDIEPTGQVSYGRIVADIEYEDTDIGLLMVERGSAWVDARYDSDPAMIDAEHQAQAHRIGLWADRSAEPPWVWRHASQQSMLNATRALW